MPREARYYKDWTARNGWRYRLWIQPANDDTTMPADLVEPDWGDDPAGGSAYIRLNDFTIVQDGFEGAAEYEGGLPIGWPNAATWDVSIDLDSLHRQGYDDLVGYLLAPGVYNPNAIQVYGTTYRPITNYNVWTIVTDRGAGGNPTTVLFQGVQRPQPANAIAVTMSKRHALFKVQLTDIARACLEAVNADTLAMWFYSNADEGRPDNADFATGILYEYLYEDGGLIYGRARARFATDVTIAAGATSTTYPHVYTKHRLWELKDLMTAVVTTADAAYRSFLRPDASVVGSWDFTGFNSTDSAADYKYATPFDHWTFYKQSYNKDGTRGDDLLYSTLSDPDTPGCLLYFVGATWPSYKTNPTDYASYYAVNDGGFLSDKSKTGLFKFPTVYDFLKAWAGSTHCRVQITYLPTGWRATFQRLNANTATATTYRHLTRSTLLKESRGSTDVEIAMGDKQLRAATATIPTAVGDDLSEVTYRVFGTRAEDERGIEPVFHTAPTVGEGADVYAMIESVPDDEGYNPDIPSNEIRIIGSSGTHDLGLYYIEATSFASNAIAVRVHDTALVPGVTTPATPSGSVLTLPTSTADFYNYYDDPEGTFWGTASNGLRDRVKRAQAFACSPYIAALRMGEEFSDPGQVGYPVRVPIAFATLTDLGERYTFVDSGATPIGGSIFLPDGRDYLGSLPSVSYLTKVTLNVVDGVSTCELLAPGVT